MALAISCFICTIHLSGVAMGKLIIGGLAFFGAWTLCKTYTKLSETAFEFEGFKISYTFLICAFVLYLALKSEEKG